MKKLVVIGNIVFACLVIHFVGQSVKVFSGKSNMQAKMEKTDKEIKELTDKKNKLLEQAKSINDDDNTDKFARNNLNLKKKGEDTYKIVD
ncbi:hypothetical protein JMUB4039_1467 [Leptotrichia trevisanii]|jgi:septum formation initiator|uniref:Septum formation initiator n=1 Tax=Leptotrichia trevisanii TaxID=109328 RepID=A0A510K6M4_9FUSO|nr:septum formation initiator family protein [Leptotrichia trevisanii]BBM45473.1 hypothetical protein JMUB3870_1592 [Leptotrichia trevisanii]BBM52687.1 hypothetical protein JMUB3935_1666 [Leptotrichia trevisanii]BBM57488.1 hypothetical protein JMUB4039_1467 [Leptotrichia trevisanii]